MRGRTVHIAAGFLLLLSVIPACKRAAEPYRIEPLERSAELTIPPYVKGTVAEYAVLAGGGDVPVQAYGVVVGLGDNGSSEVPAHLRRPIVEYLSKCGIGSHRRGTGALTPAQFLRDKDTSVVLVGGSVPHGAAVGTRFDVFVTCLPQTQTRSLEGGTLWRVDLSLAYGGISRPNMTTKIWAKAAGPIFVNPFIDPTEPTESAKLLTGRIVGGGVVTRQQPIRLQLHRPDYQMAELIQRQTHTRFDPDERLLLSKVAKGRSRSIVEITVPSDYREDHEHFLELVMHLPIRFDEGGWEGHARKMIKEMEMPVAKHDELGLVLEAMGRRVVPSIQKLYTSQIPGAAFHAARAGLRLGDTLAIDVILRFASGSDTPYQIPAILELGKHPEVLRASPPLRRLLDDPNEQVRIAAYRALLQRGDRSAVTSIEIPEQFTLDLVETRTNHIIYATQTGDPKIVLFGKGMAVARPLYFEAPDAAVTINAFRENDKLTLFRKIPVTGQISDPFEIDPSVRNLIVALATCPEPGDDGKVRSLGLTYSQVVGVLYRLAREGDIRAKFVLQQSPALQRIRTGTATVGRPDMPQQ